MRAKATKAKAAQDMSAGRSACWPALEDERRATRSPSCASPSPRPAGGPRSRRRACRSPTARWRSSPTWTLAVDRGTRVVILGLNGAGKTTLLRLLGGIEQPDTGAVKPGHGLKLGYYAQEHETLDPDSTVLENMRSAARSLADTELRKVLGSFLFTGDDVDKPAGVLSGGEKTRLALATLVLSQRQRAAARRAHEQPRPGQPRAGTFGSEVLFWGDRARHAR